MKNKPDSSPSRPLGSRRVGLGNLYLQERDTFFLALSSPLLPKGMIAEYNRTLEPLERMVTSALRRRY